MVERVLGKNEVMGPIPIPGSRVERGFLSVRKRATSDVAVNNKHLLGYSSGNEGGL